MIIPGHLLDDTDARYQSEDDKGGRGDEKSYRDSKHNGTPVLEGLEIGLGGIGHFCSVTLVTSAIYWCDPCLPPSALVRSVESMPPRRVWNNNGGWRWNEQDRELSSAVGSRTIIFTFGWGFDANSRRSPARKLIRRG